MQPLDVQQKMDELCHHGDEHLDAGEFDKAWRRIGPLQS